MGSNDFSDFVSLLYGDQSLKEILTGKNIEITDADKDNFWGRSSNAVSAAAGGKRKEAVDIIKKLLEGQLETRQILWCWNTLRQLGEFPPSGEAEEVLGFVAEVPVGNGTDYLAAYADGTARYLNYSGAAIIWEAPESGISSLINTALKAASAVIPDSLKSDKAERGSSANLKLTILTRDGLYLRGASENLFSRNPALKTFMDAATQVMLALMEKSSRAQ